MKEMSIKKYKNGYVVSSFNERDSYVFNELAKAFAFMACQFEEDGVATVALQIHGGTFERSVNFDGEDVENPHKKDAAAVVNSYKKFDDIPF